MAVGQVISLGIGSPASIPLFILVGLSSGAVPSITPDTSLLLYAVDRNESLFPMQGYDGIETLRALARDESLKPLEART